MDPFGGWSVGERYTVAVGELSLDDAGDEGVEVFNNSASPSTSVRTMRRACGVIKLQSLLQGGWWVQWKETHSGCTGIRVTKGFVGGWSARPGSVYHTGGKGAIT